VVAPFLWERRVRTIDAVFLTSPPEDRGRGLLSLVERFRVRNVFVGPRFTSAAGSRALLDALRGRGIECREIASGEAVDGLGPIHALALHPPRKGSLAGRLGPRDNSLILAIEVNGHRLLLASGLEAAGVGLLLRSNNDLRADALLVPHRVKNAEIAAELARTVRPRWAVVGSRRSFSEALRQAYDEAGAQLLLTRESGAVTIFDADGRLQAKAFLSAEQ